MKMSGTGNESIWIAHWIAGNSAASLSQVLSVKKKEKSWRHVAMQLNADPEGLGSAFVEALLAGDEERLARAVVERHCQQSLGIPVQQLSLLGQAGASLQEVILASVLAGMQGGDVLNLFRQARMMSSWGRLMVISGSSVEAIDTFLQANLSKP